MKNGKIKLSQQLLALVGIAFVLLFTSLGVVLPQILIPFAESNIYNYLSEPLKVINNDVDKLLLDTEVAYIYVVNGKSAYSDNLDEVINVDDVEKLLKKISKTHGKFIYNHKNYYYYTIKDKGITKIALTNDKYIESTKVALISAIFPIVLGTFLVIGLILVLWSTLLVRKIEKLKLKIDNIDNVNFDKAVELITKNVQDMKKGKFTDSDINVAKEFYKTSAESLMESPSRIINEVLTEEILGVEPLSERVRKIEKVTKKDIMRACKKINMDTVFLLEGGNN